MKKDEPGAAEVMVGLLGALIYCLTLVGFCRNEWLPGAFEGNWFLLWPICWLITGLVGITDPYETKEPLRFSRFILGPIAPMQSGNQRGLAAFAFGFMSCAGTLIFTMAFLLSGGHLWYVPLLCWLAGIVIALADPATREELAKHHNDGENAVALTLLGFVIIPLAREV